MGNKRQRPRVRGLIRSGLRSGLAAGMVATGGCAETVHKDRHPSDEVTPDSGAPGSGGSVAPVPDAAPPFVEPDAGPRLPPDFLADQAIANDLPLQRVLYSWTTQDQYDELRAGGDLLVRTQRPGIGGGLIRQVLADLAASGDALAQALTAPEFLKARYAWPNPWATLLGWPGESYGDKLIRIELRDDAWLMMLRGNEWQVIDFRGAPIPPAEALASPERIGAIFHIHVTDEVTCYGSFFRGGAGSFREYFLPNEAMIARWSLDTHEMRERLDADLELLRAYRDQQQSLAGEEPYLPFETLASCAWTSGYETTSFPLFDAYIKALALASPLYDPNAANLSALVTALEGALFEPDPFVHDNP